MIRFLSYPKSGRTWLRFMINDYLVRSHDLQVTNVFEVERALGANYPFEWTHLTAAMLMDLPYDMMGALDYRQFDGARMIFLTRDFRATMASAYRHAVHRIGRWNGSPSAFLRSEKYGAMKIITLYNMWMRIEPRLQDSLVVSYESALRDAAGTLAACLSFAGIAIDEAAVANSIDAGSFQAMRAASLTAAYAGTPLAPTDRESVQSFKVRTGGAGDWAELFTNEDVAFLDMVASNFLQKGALLAGSQSTGDSAGIALCEAAHAVG